MPIAASNNRSIDFIVLFSCPVVTTLEQLRFQFHTDARTDFWEIGSLAAAGTSDTPNTYHFYDTEPGPINPVLYRLQQLDYDGRFTYSNIISLTRTVSETTISLFPNPARDHIFVEGLGSGNFTITDASGREVARGPLYDARRFRIELPDGLPVGTYFLHPEGGSARRFSVLR